MSAKILRFNKKVKKHLGHSEKAKLLEQMVDFQERRKKEGKLTLSLILEGISLFGDLEQCADTSELQILSRSYKRHLEHELLELNK